MEDNPKRSRLALGKASMALLRKEARTLPSPCIPEASKQRSSSASSRESLRLPRKRLNVASTSPDIFIKSSKGIESPIKKLLPTTCSPEPEPSLGNRSRSPSPTIVFATLKKNESPSGKSLLSPLTFSPNIFVKSSKGTESPIKKSLPSTCSPEPSFGNRSRSPSPPIVFATLKKNESPSGKSSLSPLTSSPNIFVKSSKGTESPFKKSLPSTCSPEPSFGNRSRSSSPTIVFVTPKKNASPPPGKLSISPHTPTSLSQRSNHSSPNRSSPSSTNYMTTPTKKSTPNKKLIKNSPVRFLKRRSRTGLITSPYKNNAMQQLQFDTAVPSTSRSPDKNNVKNVNPTLDLINAENFCLLLNEVRYGFKESRIFTEEELETVENFINMPRQNRELYVRMFGRKLAWHRAANIRYANISNDLSPVFQDLEHNGFITSDYETEVETVVNLLDLAEVKKLCKSLSIKDINKNKPQLIQSLMKFGQFQRTINFGSNVNNSMAVLRKKITAILGHCIKLSLIPLQIFQRMVLLFSLANHSPFDDKDNGVSQHLLMIHFVQIQKMTFPSYHMIKSMQIFQTRQHFLAYEEARGVESTLTEVVKQKNWDSVSEIAQEALHSFTQIIRDDAMMDHDGKLPVFLRNYTGGSTYAYVLTISAEALKKEKKMIDDAVDILHLLLSQKLYLAKYRGRWYDQLALLLHYHMKKSTEAGKVIISALGDETVSEVWRHSLCDRAAKLVNQKKEPPEKEIKQQLAEVLLLGEELLEATSISIVSKAVQNNKPGYKKVYILEDFNKEETTYSSVEECALSHYRTLGYSEGIHCEGSVIIALFGLFFWDIIYELAVPDVFLSAYQSVPLDLTSVEFYRSRQEAVDKRLVDMNMWNSEKVKNVVEQVYQDHNGKISIVSWDRFRGEQQVVEIIGCIGISVIGKICERLVKHFRVARSGFPDLLVWAPSEAKSKFVEVKGKGDILSMKQKVWIDYLRKVGADVEVCLVNPK